MAETDNIEIYCLYLGRCDLAKGKQGIMLAPVDAFAAAFDKGTDADLSFGWGRIETLIPYIDRVVSPFAKPKGSPFNVVGGVYAVDGKLGDDGKIVSAVLARPRWVANPNAVIPDWHKWADILTAYQGQDKAHQSQVNRDRVEKKHGVNNKVTDAIDTLRLAYQASAPADKMTFRLWVFDQLAKKG